VKDEFERISKEAVVEVAQYSLAESYQSCGATSHSLRVEAAGSSKGWYKTIRYHITEQGMTDIYVLP
jgi:hypothetical protein